MKTPPDATLCAVFVYGTLKRGQCRENCWPHAPLAVTPAWTFGDLFARQDYPALMPGDNRVEGELWEFLPEQMPRVLEVLDEIEGTEGNSPNDLYHRLDVEVKGTSGSRVSRAHTYFYNRDARLDGFSRIDPVDGCQSWPA
jgi:gamma-glutamylcyclotransferase (GGCT)/AIG2-like uncharacterized protein YtfP